MTLSENHPVIKIRRETIDWVLEFIAFTFLLILIIIPFIYYSKLPEKIPVHFNIAGEPDKYGNKSSLWLLPLTGTIMYIGFTILEAFPQIYNYPVKITPENIVKQYRLATRLIRILKSVILIIFSYLSFQTINTASGATSGLDKSFLPISLLITFGVIIIYIVRSLNNRDGQ
jgi:uncharacterized membrane protein